MSQTIDKQKLLNRLEEEYHNEKRSHDRSRAYMQIMNEAKKGNFDSEVDYRQYYEQLVQAVYEFNGLSTSTAAALIAWMESVCPHFEDAHEAYKKRMKEESQ